MRASTQKSKIAPVLAGGILLFCAGGASAGAIVSAVGGVINSGGPGFGSLSDTFNQNGLLTGYTSGVTDFDTYIAGDPQHSLIFSGNEWFANEFTDSASVTYDLGAVVGIDALALWNEDFGGIGLLDLFGSTDGVTFTALSLGLTPTDNLNDADYGAEVFAFAATDLRFVRFDMSRCPQEPVGFDACSIGEVAFRAAAVAEPLSMSLLAGGLGLLGLVRRRDAS